MGLHLIIGTWSETITICKDKNASRNLEDGPLCVHMIARALHIGVSLTEPTSPTPFNVARRPAPNTFIRLVLLTSHSELVYLEGREAVLVDLELDSERPR